MRRRDWQREIIIPLPLPEGMATLVLPRKLSATSMLKVEKIVASYREVLQENEASPWREYLVNPGHHRVTLPGEDES